MNIFVSAYIFAVLMIPFVATTSNVTLAISKRSIISFPYGGLFKMVVGIAWEVILGLKQSMSCAQHLEFQFPVASYSQQLHPYPPIIPSRSMYKRDNDNEEIKKKMSDRMMAYLGIEAILNRPDYGDGQMDEDLDIEYIEAQKAGYFGVDCLTLYPSCPYGKSILDLISVYAEKIY